MGLGGDWIWVSGWARNPSARRVFGLGLLRDRLKAGSAAISGSSGLVEFHCTSGLSVSQYRDGYKVLFNDGRGFASSPCLNLPNCSTFLSRPGRHPSGKRPDVDESIAVPVPHERGPPEEPAVDWLLGEALTNLYCRIESLSQGRKTLRARLVQPIRRGPASSNLSELKAKPVPDRQDPFSNERRMNNDIPNWRRNCLRSCKDTNAPAESAEGDPELSIQRACKSMKPLLLRFVSYVGPKRKGKTKRPTSAWRLQMCRSGST